METRTTVKDNTQVIADSISSLAKAVAKLLKGPLNKKALVVLLANSSKISQKQVGRVLASLEEIERDWLN